MSTPTPPSAVKGPDGQNHPILSSRTLPSGVVIDEIKVGTGKEAALGSTVVIHYEGTLTDGVVFDSSFERSKPETFPLRRLIKGWQEGVPGMKAGGVRRLTVPPSMGYGSRSIPGIPGNSTLIFWMQLEDVK